MMRCASCHCRLLAPAYIGLGGYALGPVCAKAAGKVKPGKRRAAVLVHEIQPGQLQLF
ncbi:MAG: hypothetical protein ABJA84_00165 [Polaromonas sp.]